MKKRYQAIFLYGSAYFFITQMLSLIGFLLIYFKGYDMISSIFWFKMITSAILLYSTYLYNRAEIYMYLNVGISERFLIISIATIDLLILFFGFFIL